jgi:hypothetical protein
MPAFLINSFSCNQTLFIITTKSGFLQLTISTKKNDFCCLNRIFEKNKPIHNAIKPETKTNTIIIAQPQVAEIKLQTKINTITLALQAMNGVIRIATIRSLAELLLRLIITAGTLQPKPVSNPTTLRPLIPNLANAWSNNTEAREIMPTWLMILTKTNKIKMTGMKDRTAKNPWITPSKKKLPIHKPIAFVP